MVVDDNLSNRKLFNRFLARLLCEISVAEDGSQAVELARGGVYDVIFMDGTDYFAIQNECFRCGVPQFSSIARRHICLIPPNGAPLTVDRIVQSTCP